MLKMLSVTSAGKWAESELQHTLCASPGGLAKGVHVVPTPKARARLSSARLNAFGNTWYRSLVH